MRKLTLAAFCLLLTSGVILAATDAKKCPAKSTYNVTFRNLTDVDNIEFFYAYFMVTQGVATTDKITVRKNGTDKVKFTDGDYLLNVTADNTKEKDALGCINQTFTYIRSAPSIVKKAGYKLIVSRS